MKNYKYLWISALVILLDQISKAVVQNYLLLGETIKLTEKFFWITYVKNTGAAFSISFGNDLLNKIIFIVVPSIAIVLILIIIRKSTSKIEKITFALILGGAVGNLLDRIIHGYVIDFIWWDFPDFIMERWPVFNIADSSIVLAISIMILFSIFLYRRK